MSNHRDRVEMQQGRRGKVRSEKLLETAMAIVEIAKKSSPESGRTALQIALLLWEDYLQTLV